MWNISPIDKVFVEDLIPSDANAGCHVIHELQFPVAIPELYTERLVLSRIDQIHVDDYFHLCSQKETMRSYNVLAHEDKLVTTKTIEFLHEEFLKKQSFRFGMFIKSSGQMVGDLGFWQIDYRRKRVELGFKLSSDFRKTGLMSEALVAVVDFAFTHMCVHAIDAHVAIDNISSIQFLSRSGFIQEASRREFIFSVYDQCYKDALVFSLLEGDFRKS